MSIYGLHSMIKFFYNVTRKKWLASLIVSIALAKFFIHAVCPWEIELRIIQTIFRVNLFHLMCYI